MKNVTYINAGAGSGKTHTLTQTLTDLIKDGKVKPEQVILTTFTTKAANEFKEKAKAFLFKEGLYNEAVSLDHAMIGTVHSVCQRMIGKYWFNLGLSPNMGVMAEEDTTFYISQSLAELPTDDELKTLHDFAAEFDIRVREGITIKHAIDYDFWQKDLKNIIDFATNYEVEDFTTSTEESLNFIRQFMRAGNDYEYTYDELLAVVDEHERFLRGCKQSATNDKRINALVKARKSLHKPTIGLLKAISDTIGTPKGFGPLAESFKQHMAGVWTSGMLYRKQEEYINILFNLAQRWKENFAQFKREKNLLDYNDMEKYMRLLMQNADVASEISQSYRYLFVDEFQDSSPIQVKIFDALSDLMEHSYWVGDYKQAIYGFRGSDIALTKAVVDRIAKEEDGCNTDTLDTSYRSLPDIVEVNNDVFCKTFADVLDRKNIHLKQHRKNETKEKSLRYFCTSEEAGIAEHILRLINLGAKPNEIAVLARANATLAEVAEDLNSLEIPCSREDTPITLSDINILVSSLLRIVDSSKDALAKATVAMLTAPECNTKYIIEEKILHDDNPDAEPEEYLSNVPLVSQLLAIKPELQQKSISSLVESMIIGLNLFDVTKTFEMPSFAAACLQTIISTAKVYESHCIQMNLPSTIDGFISYLEEVNPAGYGDPEGVQLHTYHSSKGLQWKYVILMSLNTDVANIETSVRNATYGVHVVHKSEPTAENPYPEVFIRLTPWVYGTAKHVPDVISNTVEASEEFKAAYKSMLAENNRVLYVGMTRARDVMIMNIEPLKKGQKRLNWPISQGVDTVIANIPDTGVWDIFGNGHNFIDFTLTHKQLGKLKPYSKPDKTKEMQLNIDNRECITRAPRYLSPSKLEGVGVVTHVKDFGMRITFTKKPSDMADVGNCIHQIYAGIEELRPAYKIEMEEIIDSYGLTAVFDDTSFITAAWENLKKYLTETYGVPVRTYHERPFRLEKEGQTIIGSIDLVWETKEGVVLIDYKTCPLGIDAIMDPESEYYAGRYAGQLDAYDDALTAAGEKVIAHLVYYPVNGNLVQVGRKLDRELPYPYRDFHIFLPGKVTPKELWNKAKPYCSEDNFSGEILISEKEDSSSDYLIYSTLLAGDSTQGVIVHFQNTEKRTTVHLSLGLFAMLGDVKLAFAYMEALTSIYPESEIYFNDNIDDGLFVLDDGNFNSLLSMGLLNLKTLLMNTSDHMFTGIPGAIHDFYLPKDYIDEEDMDNQFLYRVADDFVCLQWNYPEYEEVNMVTITSPQGEESNMRIIANNRPVLIGLCQKIGVLNSRKRLKLVERSDFIEYMNDSPHFKMVDAAQFVLDQMSEHEWDAIFEALPGVEIGNKPMRTRKTYLLRWNPAISSFKMEAYKEARETYPGGFGMDWSIHEWEEAKEGDLYYMLRVGEGNTGICFYGEFTSNPYVGGDWAGKGKIRHYVDINCDDAVDPDGRPLATTEELQKAIPEIDWQKGHSGQLLTEEQADKIGEIISSHLQ